MMTKEQESATKTTETETIHVRIEKGEEGCTANPDSFHVDRGATVVFENLTGGLIVLIFFKDGLKNDPFVEKPQSNGARPIAANEKLTVRASADTGSYRYKITGPGCHKPSHVDAPEIDTDEDEYQVGVYFVMAAMTKTDPEMIVD